MRGVQKGDASSQKLFILALEDIFNDLNWNKKPALLRDYISSTFVSETILFCLIALLGRTAEDVNRTQTGIVKTGLTMKIGKIEATNRNDRTLILDNDKLERVDKYVLGDVTKLDKEDQTDKINGRARMIWTARGNLEFILKKENKSQ